MSDNSHLNPSVPTHALKKDDSLRDEAGTRSGVLCCHSWMTALAPSPPRPTRLPIPLLAPLHFWGFRWKSWQPGKQFPQMNRQPSTPQEHSLLAWLTEKSLMVDFSPAAQTLLFNNEKKKKNSPLTFCCSPARNEKHLVLTHSDGGRPLLMMHTA